MAKQTVFQEVKARMEEMQTRKRDDLAAIEQKKIEAQAQKDAAELAIKTATERMDLEGYEEAKAARTRAQMVIDMCAGRYKQISAQEYVSEEESDRVQDSLAEYRTKIAEDFKTAICEPLRTLAKLLEDYKAEDMAVSATMRTWANEIHANYRNPFTTYSETGTNRSQKPVPVEMIILPRCGEAGRLERMLGDFPEITKE